MPLKLYKHPRSPNWYIRGTLRGVKVDESTGIADKKFAETFRAKKEWQIIQGAIIGRRIDATFLDGVLGYLEDGGEGRFIQPILDIIGATPLSQIDSDMIRNVAAKLYPDGQNSTINRHIYTPISAILRHAAKRKLCDTPQIERPRQPKGRIRYLIHEESERLIKACAPHLRPLVIFLLYTGARVGEALKLEWRHVDLGRKHVTLIDTKNGDDRGIPLAPRVFLELANMPHRIGAVFRRRDGLPYVPKDEGGGQIKTGFRGACKRAKIEDFSPHDCRHTWATWHYQANRDLIVLMKLGGWKSERMVLRYAHANVENLASSVMALPGAMGRP